MNLPIIVAFGIAIVGLLITATAGFFAMRDYLREEREQRPASQTSARPLVWKPRLASRGTRVVAVYALMANQLAAREAAVKAILAQNMGHWRNDALKIHNRRDVHLLGRDNPLIESTELRRRRIAIAAGV